MRIMYEYKRIKCSIIQIPLHFVEPVYEHDSLHQSISALSLMMTAEHHRNHSHMDRAIGCIYYA